MINICGSNLIPIFITLLCCGAIFIYFNMRFNEIKCAVEKQNRVLTAFITNVQDDIRHGGMPNPAAGLAAPEAIIAAQKFVNEKIIVSDDEDDDDDSDSESDDDSDMDVSDDEMEESKPTGNINLHEMNVEQMIPISFEVLSFVSEPLPNSSTSSITEITDEPLNLVNSIHISNDVIIHKNEPELNYEHMRVDDLRKLVSDKNLATKEDVKKLKKPELIVMLKK